MSIGISRREALSVGGVTIGGAAFGAVSALSHSATPAILPQYIRLLGATTGIAALSGAATMLAVRDIHDGWAAPAAMGALALPAIGGAATYAGILKATGMRPEIGWKSGVGATAVLSAVVGLGSALLADSLNK
jgi:hypothetical protein